MPSASMLSASMPSTCQERYRSYVDAATHLVSCDQAKCEVNSRFIASVSAAADSKDLRRSIDILKANLVTIANTLPSNHPQIGVRSLDSVLQLSPRRFVFGSLTALCFQCYWCGRRLEYNGFPKQRFIAALTDKTLRCAYCPQNCQSCGAEIGHSAEFDTLSPEMLLLLHTLCLPCVRDGLKYSTPPALSVSTIKSAIRRSRGR